MLFEVIGSTLANLVVLFGVPLLLYSTLQKWRRKRSLRESLERLGLRRGEPRFIGYCVAASVLLVGALVLWPPPVALFTREGSAQRVFLGMGWSDATVTAASLYGVVQTGFSEEFLFRGLIAGALGRRMSNLLANLLQATIFLAPHLLIVVAVPELWGLIPLVFAGALFAGWVRLESGSILGPWILHATVNTTMALSIAVRSAG